MYKTIRELLITGNEHTLVWFFHIDVAFFNSELISNSNY